MNSPSTHLPLQPPSAITTRPVHTLAAGHTGSVHVVKFNLPGSYVLSGGQDRRVVLCNADTGAFVKSYQLHAYEVLDIAIARDSSMFASCGGDKTVYLWDAASGNTLRRFSGHMARVNSVAFNDPETVLATASYDGSVRLWDLRSSSAMRPIQVLSEARDSVSAVDIHEHLIASASVDGRLRVYDLRMGQLTTDIVAATGANVTHQAAGAGTPLTSVMISPDGDTALVEALDSTARLVDLESGVTLQAYVGHENRLFRMRAVLDADAGLVLAASEDATVCVWDLMAGEAPLSRIAIESAGGKPLARAPLAFDYHALDPDFGLEAGVLAACGAGGVIGIYRVIT